MMSVRDALYDAMFDEGNRWGIDRAAILVDIVHVGDWGAQVYAAFLAWAVRHQVTRLMLHHRCVVGRQARLRLACLAVFVCVCVCVCLPVLACRVCCQAPALGDADHAGPTRDHTHTHTHTPVKLAGA
jgi:hypothetical protein